MSLERCFEHDLAPPADFLRWMIQNPNRLTWPNNGRAKFGASTQQHREALFGLKGEEAMHTAQREALTELHNVEPIGSRRRWWAFEGFTSADCYLETDNLVLLIEGKRFENVSSAVQWYPCRNQLIRNLEAAHQAALGKDFAVLAIGEKPLAEMDSGILAASLPHLAAEQRDELWSHYLGSTTWMAVCQAMEINYAQLPSTADDAIVELKALGYFRA